jgi:hypothetical protein
MGQVDSTSSLPVESVINSAIRCDKPRKQLLWQGDLLVLGVQESRRGAKKINQLNEVTLKPSG